VELETDKVNMEVTSTGSGVLQSIVKSEGDTVNIGDVIAVVAESASAGNGSAQPAATPPAESPAPWPATPSQPSPEETAEDASDGGRSTPLARRIASEHGIDISRVPGTGPSGRVTREDVNAFLNVGSQPAAQPAPP